jgi:DMSO/TMAO reductase YedYZ heme-binding membrane subunit
MWFLHEEAHMISILLLLALILIIQVFPISLNIVVMTAGNVIMIYKYPKVFKSDILWYIITTLLAALSVYFYEASWTQYVTKGYLSLALFIIVMFTGVIPVSWGLTKSLMKVRGLLSILGFILISPHAVLHLFDVFDGVNLFGIVAYALMVPLTIVSFKTIRKEIKPKDWNKIQQAAYAIYVLLYVHTLWVGPPVDQMVYMALFVLYVNNKLVKEFKK